MIFGAEWADIDRGHSPEIWLRAVGWYSMALVDALDILPASHPGRDILLSQIHALFPCIVSAADLNSGVWWLVMTQSGRVGNYFESSGSAMFVYSLLKAVRLGYPSDSDGTTVAAAKKAYGYMVDNWVVDHEDGTMDWKDMVLVGSLNTTGSYEVRMRPTLFNCWLIVLSRLFTSTMLKFLSMRMTLRVSHYLSWRALSSNN